MTVNEIVTMINTIGFPIACVVALAYYVREITKEHKEEVKNLSDSFASVVNEIKDLSYEVKTLLEEERKDRKNENE